MPRTPDVLRLLQRSDKHSIGGGNRLLWAPPFPLYEDCPGLWDEAHYFDYCIRPLFTWTLLDEENHEIPLRFVSRRWDPSQLVCTFAGQSRRGSLAIRETRCLLPLDVILCILTARYRGKGKLPLHLVAWTAQENAARGDGIADAAFQGEAFTFLKLARPADRPEAKIGAAFGLASSPRSSALQAAEGRVTPPRWDLTPFPEVFAGGFPSEAGRLRGLSGDGAVYMALHQPWELQAGREEQTAMGMAFAPRADEALREFLRVVREGAPAAASVSRWNEEFSGVPRFRCSDEYFEHYYWYRWYGLRLNALPEGEPGYRHATVCEGPASLRVPVSPASACHMLENRWRHDPALAQGSLLTFVAHQREDGSFPGRIEPFRTGEGGLRHAGWGNALLQLDAVHHSVPFLRQVHEGLVRLARYFDKERDREGSGLYDVTGRDETAEEFAPRLAAATPVAGAGGEGEVNRVKGVDATVQVYELKRALAVVTRALGKPGEAELWEIEADKIRNAVRARMWDAGEEMFFDIDPASQAHTRVKCPACFTPYSTDIVSAEHLPGLQRHLFNSSEFWTPFPVPSLPADDESFSAEGLREGIRTARPWNGRVWPVCNSAVADALARSAIAFNEASLRQKTAELIRSFIRMMFFEGEASRPNAFEHYSPLSGRPGIYRGIDDCLHSWVVDLIIKYVCGVRPTRDALVVDPFPFGLQSASIDDVRIRGKRIRVEIARRKFTVWIDGKTAGTSTLGAPLAFPLK